MSDLERAKTYAAQAAEYWIEDRWPTSIESLLQSVSLIITHLEAQAPATEPERLISHVAADVQEARLRLRRRLREILERDAEHQDGTKSLDEATRPLAVLAALDDGFDALVRDLRAILEAGDE